MGQRYIGYCVDGISVSAIGMPARPLAICRQAGQQPPRIELHHPVPDDLKSDATDPRRLGARRTFTKSRRLPVLRLSAQAVRRSTARVLSAIA
jgi:hypothetical protein